MKYQTDIHHRRSLRLKNYDYAQAGVYFVSICAQSRACLFGNIVNEEMVLNVVGKIVAEEWIKTVEIRNNIELDEWVVMPNHFHGILVINECRGGAPPYGGTIRNLFLVQFLQLYGRSNRL